MALKVLAAGATESVLRDTVGIFAQQSGHTVTLAFAPAGAVRDKLCAGEPADVALVTPAVLEQLLAKGLVRPDTRTDLGQVGGGIAVRAGADKPAIGTPADLKQALLAAQEIYFADPKIATAGAYFLTVADRLGIMDEVQERKRLAGGGKEAMEFMAKSGAAAIGVTQISEILSVTDVVLVGPYPGDLQTMTMYTGVQLARTAEPETAQAFLRFLTSPTVQARFTQAGYESVAR